MGLWRFVWVLLAACVASASTEEAARKLLAARCWACHTQTAMGGLRMDTREAMLQGGKSGAAIVPGQAAQSRMFQAVARNTPGVLPMPPGPPLKAEEVALIRQWIDEGAPWREEESHWAYRPLRNPATGASIDAILASTHRTKGLAANPLADRRTLIRRASFDLTGLPPSLEEFQQALDDSRPDWFARYVNRLLASPHFAEKWARHWLDVARFGEDDFTGTEVVPYPNAWRYRDWVVQAIQSGMPYDRFLMAQLAGDLMGDPSLLPATGLLGLGPWYYGIAQPAQSRADERNDRVDMVSRGMLGVTLACARCHDHKYDPFGTAEYYALAGVFASTAYKEYPLVPDSEVAAWTRQKDAVDAAEKALKQFVEEKSKQLATRYSAQIADLMMATQSPRSSVGLPPKLVDRWKNYLAKPEDKHPYLRPWFQGKQTRKTAEAFARLIHEISAEKRAIDDENQRLVEAAKAQAPRVQRTIVLPGGYRSEEDFNPGADIPAKSLDRDRFVAWNRIFGEKQAPLRFDEELTVELLTGPEREEYQRLKTAAETLKAALPPKYPFLHGAAEFEPWDLPLHKRGNPNDLGEVIPRGFPKALSDGKQIRFTEGSGRLELARIVAHHPLAARVAVNRIWMALFGQGIVATPSNFGAVGDRPATPELLEYLAGRFAQRGYSLKETIREIMLSAAYQRTADLSPANARIDGANRTFWRQSRRRLEAESLLDSMLAASGELDRRVGGESQPLGPSFVRRSLYAKTSRFQQDETLSLFDLPSALVTCEQRVVTTVPLQKLFLMNSEITAKRAEALGRRIARESPAEGISAAYRQVYHRDPNAQELQLGLEFLRDGRATRWREYAWVLLSSNEFAYVD